MLIATPKELLPYVRYGRGGVMTAAEDMPEELQAKFAQFRDRMAKIKEERRRELLAQ